MQIATNAIQAERGLALVVDDIFLKINAKCTRFFYQLDLVIEKKCVLLSKI